MMELFAQVFNLQQKKQDLLTSFWPSELDFSERIIYIYHKLLGLIFMFVLFFSAYNLFVLHWDFMDGALIYFLGSLFIISRFFTKSARLMLLEKKYELVTKT